MRALLVGPADFPSWFSASVYGGLACAVLSSIVVAAWALIRRRGTSAQVVGALLACLIASALDTIPVFWVEYRLNVYGPTLPDWEIAVVLLLNVTAGWLAPLSAMLWFLFWATASTVGDHAIAQRFDAPDSTSRPVDPARRRLALADGQPWGMLVPLASGEHVRSIPLEREHVLIGREASADLTLQDDRVSRYHAELRWNHGRVSLVDLDSRNGTRVNSLAIVGQALLQPGDVIELGSSQFRFDVKAAADELATIGPVSEHAAGQNAPEQQETRKTPGVSGVFGFGGRTLELCGVAGSYPAQRWILEAPVTMIGRDSVCAIVLDDESVSRLHAQITRQPTGYYVTDLNSSNGVFVNGGRLVGPAQFIAGDVLRFGDIDLTVGLATRPDALIAEADALETPTIPKAASAVGPRADMVWQLRVGARKASQPRLAPPRLAPEDSMTPPPEEKEE